MERTEAAAAASQEKTCVGGRCFFLRVRGRQALYIQDVQASGAQSARSIALPARRNAGILPASFPRGRAFRTCSLERCVTSAAGDTEVLAVDMDTFTVARPGAGASASDGKLPLIPHACACAASAALSNLRLSTGKKAAMYRRTCPRLPVSRISAPGACIPVSAAV